MSVYFIYQSAAGAALMKIGRAKDIYRRRATLQTGNPHPLSIVGWIETTSDHALGLKPNQRLKRSGFPDSRFEWITGGWHGAVVVVG